MPRGCTDEIGAGATLTCCQRGRVQHGASSVQCRALLQETDLAELEPGTASAATSGLGTRRPNSPVSPAGLRNRSRCGRAESRPDLRAGRGFDPLPAARYYLPVWKQQRPAGPEARTQVCLNKTNPTQGGTDETDSRNGARAAGPAAGHAARDGERGVHPYKLRLLPRRSPWAVGAAVCSF